MEKMEISSHLSPDQGSYKLIANLNATIGQINYGERDTCAVQRVNVSARRLSIA